MLALGKVRGGNGLARCWFGRQPPCHGLQQRLLPHATATERQLSGIAQSIACLWWIFSFKEEVLSTPSPQKRDWFNLFYVRNDFRHAPRTTSASQHLKCGQASHWLIYILKRKNTDYITSLRKPWPFLSLFPAIHLINVEAWARGSYMKNWKHLFYIYNGDYWNFH